MFNCPGSETGAIVKRLNVIEDIGTHQIVGLTDLLLDAFLFQAAEE